MSLCKSVLAVVYSVSQTWAYPVSVLRNLCHLYNQSTSFVFCLHVKGRFFPELVLGLRSFFLC